MKEEQAGTLVLNVEAAGLSQEQFFKLRGSRPAWICVGTLADLVS